MVPEVARFVLFDEPNVLLLEVEDEAYGRVRVKSMWYHQHNVLGGFWWIWVVPR